MKTYVFDIMSIIQLVNIAFLIFIVVFLIKLYIYVSILLKEKLQERKQQKAAANRPKQDTTQE